MGSVLSSLRLLIQTLKSISESYYAVSKRISADPGLPVPHPSRSYWCDPPAPLPEPDSILLPSHVDVVIIGSGIAGTAIARTFLDHQNLKKDEKGVKIVMLEAREVCSGATGRNGGHISPNLYQDYSRLVAAYGTAAARDIIRFRLAHLPTLLEVAAEEDLLQEAQARKVQQIDVYLEDQLYRHAQRDLEEYVHGLPERRTDYIVHETRSDLEALQLSQKVSGCLSTWGGALHPYRFVTGILTRLINAYPSFQLFTHTPCTAIESPGGGANYIVTTPRGTISTPHVIHATNAWSSHLLPQMRTKIVPMRAHMTAQRPGLGLGNNNSRTPWTGSRSFVFYPGTSPIVFDYLTQQPLSQKNGKGALSSSDGELMFGGGAMLGGEATAMKNIGIADDTDCDFEVSAYLGGALERYFSGWGHEGKDSVARPAAKGWGDGRMKALWSGILGLSADGQPWVGRIPCDISQRPEPTGGSNETARPGEWIAAGFTGEGMTHAWLSGVALAHMVLNRSEDSISTPVLPAQFQVTHKRWKEADIHAFLAQAA
ncbi:nucleotide-binding domain-containing protein [Mycena rebaudengoi]|nr:nucleotide-binding domain-containing protein [Mycena rebaudengoi]